MPRWVELLRHTVIVVFVCLCVILQCAFLCDCNELSNESYNATASTTTKLARFLL